MSIWLWCNLIMLAKIRIYPMMAPKGKVFLGCYWLDALCKLRCCVCSLHFSCIKVSDVAVLPALLGLLGLVTAIANVNLLKETQLMAPSSKHRLYHKDSFRCLGWHCVVTVIAVDELSVVVLWLICCDALGLKKHYFSALCVLRSVRCSLCSVCCLLS